MSTPDDPQNDRYELAVSLLASTPAALDALLERLPQDVWMWSPAPGEWSPYETLTHLLHVETAVFPVRVRQMIEQDGAPLASGGEPAAAPPPHETLRTWRHMREQNLAMLKTLSPAQLARTGEHKTFGRISAREHIVEWAYHDLEHLRQMQAIVEARLYPAIGVFRKLYNPPYPLTEQSS
jgi:hypothetical protein